jgi:hypothetical protein
MNNQARLFEPIFRESFNFVVVAILAVPILGLAVGLVGETVGLGNLFALIGAALGVAIPYRISGRVAVACLRDLSESVVLTTGVITAFLSNLDGDKDFLIIEPGGRFWIRSSYTAGWAKEGMRVDIWHYPRSHVATAVRNAEELLPLRDLSV